MRNTASKITAKEGQRGAKGADGDGAPCPGGKSCRAGWQRAAAC